MKITVRNSPDRKFIRYVKIAVEYFANYLMTPKKLENISIKVVFKEIPGDFVAFASVIDEDVFNNPNSFLIEISPALGAKQTFRTLAHEMVHVKQYVKKEIDEDINSWKGVNVHHDDYYKFPWEIEAYGQEQGMFEQLVIKYGLWKVFEGIVNPADDIPRQKIVWKK